MLLDLFLGLFECNSSLFRLVFLQYCEESTTYSLSETLGGVSYYSLSLKLSPSLLSVDYLLL